MVKEMKILFAVLLIAVLVSFVCAAETTDITVKTMPGYNFRVTLGVYGPSCGEALNSGDGIVQEKVNNKTGEAEFTYTGSESKITFSTYVTLGSTLYDKKDCGSYPNYTTGTTITLNALGVVAAKNTTNSTNSTSNSTANKTTNSTIANKTTNITNSTLNLTAITNQTTINATEESFGAKASKVWASSAVYVYYVLGAIILLVIGYLIFIQVRKMKSTGHPSYSSPNKKDHSSEDVRITKDPRIERELEEAQKKIKEAQDVIDRINHRETKLFDAEKKFEEAKKELDRAKRGF